MLMFTVRIHSVLVGLEDSIFTFNGTVSADDPDVSSDSYSSAKLHGSVTAVHKSRLMVQEIRTSAVHIDAIQRIALVKTGSAASSGFFSLALDLSHLGCGISITPNVTFDANAVSNINSVGYAASMHKAVSSLACLAVCGITVSVSRPDGGGVTDWLVTFHNASYKLPLLRLEETSLSTGLAVRIDNYLPGNSIGGYFTLSWGLAVSPYLLYNASAEDVSMALDALAITSAVSVSRSERSDRQGGFVWSVTFFDTLGTYGILAADASQLTGVQYVNSPDTSLRIPIPPTITVSIAQYAEGVPLVSSVTTNANRIDQTVQIQLSTSLVDQFEVPNVFSVTVRDTASRKAATIGPFFATTLSQASLEFSHPTQGTFSSYLHMYVLNHPLLIYICKFQWNRV
jgi:hypothetical protein